MTKVSNPGQEYSLGEWRSVDTIPTREPVVVLTVTGIVCKAKTDSNTRWIRRPGPQVPFRRVMCFRLDGRTNGDVRAIGWKSLDDGLPYKAMLDRLHSVAESVE